MALAPSGQPTDVVAALVRRGGQILICQRPPGGELALEWEFPGGKVDPGERPEQALARELREELGVDAQIGPLVFEHTHAYGPDRVAHLLFYEAAILGDPQALEHAAVRWVKPVGLRLFRFVAGDGPIVEKLARGEL
ncbi:MAG: (deoxy)nucleoside triphosphate pyrophosphohydrolase [Candidatus Sumerlaeia bacterium]|nr:(deoxy)nucleoside triphosphate pyrophosphohydrolase [Candidatus Sumerlaeia bacterium]